MSDVKGESEVYAATANELNATSTRSMVVSTVPWRGPKLTHMAHRSKGNCSGPIDGMLLHIQLMIDIKAYVDDPDFPKHLQLLIIPDIRDPTNEGVFPSIQLDAIRETSAMNNQYAVKLPLTCECWQATPTSDASACPGSSSAALGASSRSARLRY